VPEKGGYDTIVSDPEGYEVLQVKAMAVLIRAIQVCYAREDDKFSSPELP